MICFECCKAIDAYPCACGARPKGPSGASFLIQHCTTAGCMSAIRVRVGQQEAGPVCKWCEKHTAYYFGQSWKKRTASHNA